MGQEERVMQMLYMLVTKSEKELNWEPKLGLEDSQICSSLAQNHPQGYGTI